MLLVSMPKLLHAESKSPRYYDPISGQFISQEQLNIKTARELILEAKVQNIVLGEIVVQEIDNALWTSLSDVIILLDFPIKIKAIDDKKIEASGWFIKERNLFSLLPENLEPKKTSLSESNNDTKNTQLVYQLKTSQQTQTIDNIKQIDGVTYFPLVDILSWFNIEAKSNIEALSLELLPTESLPIQEKILRDQRKASALTSDFDTQFPRDDVEYQMFSPLMTDIQISAFQGSDGNKIFNTSALGAGDLAYMTGRYYLGHRYNERTESSQVNGRLYLERNTIQSDLTHSLQPTHFSLGDSRNASIANLPGTNKFGVRVSNRPYGRITNSSTTNITGLQQPGWDAELYLNGLFIDKQTVDKDGQYNFLNQPLQIGENRFTLRFYGLEGQKRELEKVYHLDPAAATGGGLIYDASFGQQDFNFSDFFEKNQPSAPPYYALNFHLEKGLSQKVSITGDYSQYHFSDGVQHQFAQTGLRAFLGQTFIDINHLQDIEFGSQSQFNLSRGLGLGGKHVLNYGIQTQTQDFKVNTTTISSIKQSQTISLNGKLLTLDFDYKVSATFGESYDQSSTESYQLNLAKSLGRLRLNNNLNYSITHVADNTTSKSMTGRLNATTYWSKVYLRAGLDYLVEPISRTENVSLEASWNMTNNLKTKLLYSYANATDTSATGLTLNWRNRNFSSSFSIRNSEHAVSGQINLYFSLGKNPITNKIFMDSSRVSSSGAVAVQVFEDLNNNQQFDKNEPLIEDAEVLAVQQHIRAKTNEQGVVMLTGLRGSQVTDIKVNTATLPDPFWTPSTDGISFLPRPGLIKTILIPIVTAGEIEGVVKYSEDLFNAPYERGRVPLLLTNIENGKSIEIDSTFDGFFLFEKVPQGNYSLQIKPSFLQTNSLEARSPIPIKIGHRGTLVLGVNFTIHPEGKFEYSTEEPIADTAYNIDLGEFLSEENARIVLGALRNVFPSVLAKGTRTNPYEMLLTKSNKNRYQLALGPVFDLNHAKYICGSLAKEQLYCQVKKTKIKVDYQPEILPAVQAIGPLETALKTAILEKSSEPKITESTKQNSNQNFTLQLMSTLSDSGLEAYIEENSLMDSKIIAVTNKDGETKYLLTMGNYAIREDAEQIAAQLHDYLGVKPWIRTFESIYAK